LNITIKYLISHVTGIGIGQKMQTTRIMMSEYIEINPCWCYLFIVEVVKYSWLVTWHFYFRSDTLCNILLIVYLLNSVKVSSVQQFIEAVSN